MRVCKVPWETNLGHSAINDEVGAVDEAALVAGKEHNSMRLLDGFAKATRGKMNLATMTLDLIVTQPVLQQGSTADCSALLHNDEPFQRHT